MDPIDTRRRRASVIAALILAVTVTGCGGTGGGSGDPFARCPAGQHRVHDPALPPSRWWVCQ